MVLNKLELSRPATDALNFLVPEVYSIYLGNYCCPLSQNNVSFTAQTDFQSGEFKCKPCLKSSQLVY